MTIVEFATDIRLQYLRASLSIRIQIFYPENLGKNPKTIPTNVLTLKQNFHGMRFGFFCHIFDVCVVRSLHTSRRLIFAKMLFVANN